MFLYIYLEIISGVIGFIIIAILITYLLKHLVIHNTIKKSVAYSLLILFLIAVISGLLANKTYPPNFAMPLFMHSHTPDQLPASIPFNKIIYFLINKNKFEKVDNISADANLVPENDQKPDSDGIVRIHLTTKEVISEIAPGIYFNYWTYNGQVPGPMLRIKEGETIELSLTNDITSLHHHNIDLHAVTGPGGGATLTDVNPGETKTIRWKALNPGLYIYHCAMPNVSTHNSHGQYGLILVDPKDPKLTFEKVDKEFYITQGEFYTIGQTGKKGLVPFDSDALLDGKPNYVVFNGKINNTPLLHAKVGDKIRIYIGNGGVNLISSFHIIGEIFDKVYPEGAIGENSSILKNVQTTAVLPGGSSIVELKLDVPGKYLIVDHALARMNKGAWAILEVSGPEQKDIFSGLDNKSNTETNMHNDMHME
ncbi:multicopper oxidase domain-containing protein [Candidatus Nomurabacteria bacterium]|nr:multicopper oxidase domain-containing protein [Candidatus Nomurabacteria bacterium]